VKVLSVCQISYFQLNFAKGVGVKSPVLVADCQAEDLATCLNARAESSILPRCRGKT